MASIQPHFKLQQAQEQDLSTIANLCRLSFQPTSDPKTVEQEWFNQGLSPDGRQWFLTIDELTQQVVGTAAQLNFKVFLESQEFSLAGLAAVAVAPERRGQRVASFMVSQIVSQIQSQNIPIAMLYPFRHSFYRKLGWAWVGRLHQYTVQTRHLPLYPERVGIVSYNPEIHKQGLQDAYLRSAMRHNGWLKRSPVQWERHLLLKPAQAIYCYVEGGKVLGYGMIEFQKEPKAIVVLEWVALNIDAYRGLLGFLASLQDQIPTILWNTYPEDPFPHLLHEQQRDMRYLPAVPKTLHGLIHRFGELGGGFMWRLVDIQTAFRLRPITQDTPFVMTFQVSDPILGDQTITANFAAGRMHPVSKPVPSVVKISIEHLTELFCGLRRATELVWTREIEFEGERSLLQKLDIAWQCTPPFCWDIF